MGPPSLPPELLMMVFQHITDWETKAHIRLSSRIGYASIDKRELFRTLRLHKNRLHAVKKVADFEVFGLLRYVEECIVCTSSYAPAAVLFDDDEIHATFETTNPYRRDSICKFEAFLSHTLRLLECSSNTTPRKRLRLEVLTDEDDDTTKARILFPNYYPRVTYRQKFSFTMLFRDTCDAFNTALGKYFEQSPPHQRTLDIYRVDYKLRHLEFFQGLASHKFGYPYHSFNLRDLYMKGTGNEYWMRFSKGDDGGWEVSCTKE